MKILSDRAETDALSRLKALDLIEQLQIKVTLQTGEVARISGLLTTALDRAEKAEERATKWEAAFAALTLKSDAAIQSLTERAEKAERALEEMRQWVPKRIEALETEIQRLQGLASMNADARTLEAETASTLANTAAAETAAALLMTPPTLPSQAEGEQPAVTANTVTVTELPATIEVVQKPLRDKE